MLWDGDGTVGFGMEAKRVRYVSPGVAEVQVHLSSQTNNGLTVQIERTNPKDPVRNLHVVMPGYENQFLAQPFHPTFLEAMKKYKIIRFMKWMDGDGAGKGDWASRPTRQSASYAWSHLNRPKGASLEDIIFLSNRLGASPWFVLQTSIEDDYVTKFAALVRDTLRPDVKVYVELGNEVWSTLHRTGQYAHEQGLRTGLGPHPYIRLYCETWPQAAHFSQVWADAGWSSEREKLLKLSSLCWCGPGNSCRWCWEHRVATSTYCGSCCSVTLGLGAMTSTLWVLRPTSTGMYYAKQRTRAVAVNIVNI